MSNLREIRETLEDTGFYLDIPAARETSAEELTEQMRQISEDAGRVEPIRSYFRMGLLAVVAVERVHILEQEARDAGASDPGGRGDRSAGGGVPPAGAGT